MNSRYGVIISWSQEDDCFVAEVPELTGCMADGDTSQEALAKVETVIEQWIETTRQLGRPIPRRQGRRLYGTYPSLALGGPDGVGGGRMIPTTSADQYAATLAKWFGVADADLVQVAPHLGSFVTRDLGFLF
jgi:predicted RNase H-like HicB family nuclease